MLKIFNDRVYGIEESLIASGYPMIAEEIQEFEDNIELCDKDYKRASKLGNVPSGTGHDNFLKGIIVQFDVTYPGYWTPQFQRYHFADIVSSTSKMHKIVKMNLDEACNEYVDDEVKQRVNHWVGCYNLMEQRKSNEIFSVKGESSWYATMEDAYRIINKNIEEKYHCSVEDIEKNIEKRYTKYEVYMKIISNCPMGLEQTMRVTTSYLQLKTIYLQRRHHKLKEDWGNFCDWCESLPHFKEWCIGKK
ncbi:MAG: hypothetical protein ACRC23_01855 [Aeromonas jandaei]